MPAQFTSLRQPPADRSGVSRRTLFRGAIGSGAAALALSAFGGAIANAATPSGGLPSHPQWKFVFVNHVTTNPFFVPTQYGIADACALLNCTWQWTGSQTSVASEMVNALNAAVAAKADAIAVSLVDQHAFNAPVKNAMDAGIPVSRTTPTPPAMTASPTSARTSSPPVRRSASGSPTSSAKALSLASSRRPAS